MNEVNGIDETVYITYLDRETAREFELHRDEIEMRSITADPTWKWVKDANGLSGWRAPIAQWERYRHKRLVSEIRGKTKKLERLAQKQLFD
jgi:hypothetical protein